MIYKINMRRKPPVSQWVVRSLDSRPVGVFSEILLINVTGLFRCVGMQGWFEVDGLLTREGDTATISGPERQEGDPQGDQG